MTLADWLLAAVAAAAAVVLITSGIAKLVAPAPLRRALAELSPASGRHVTSAVVRGLGAAEIAVAVGMLVEPARLASAIAAAALGASFLGLGTSGLLRGAKLPCGCFGAASQRPLGLVSVAWGVALLAPWPVVAEYRFTSPVSAASYSAAATLLTSIGAVLVCLAQNRRLIKLPGFGVRPTLTSKQVR